MRLCQLEDVTPEDWGVPDSWPQKIDRLSIGPHTVPGQSEDRVLCINALRIQGSSATNAVQTRLCRLSTTMHVDARLIRSEASLPMFTAALDALYAIWVWSKGVAFLRFFKGSDARVMEP